MYCTVKYTAALTIHTRNGQLSTDFYERLKGEELSIKIIIIITNLIDTGLFPSDSEGWKNYICAVTHADLLMCKANVKNARLPVYRVWRI